MPDSSDNYQLPSWPPTLINRDLWNAVMGSIAQRLTAREELEATFEALIAQGTQASLDYIQATVAPQIASLQTSIELAQEQIDQIIVDGVAPNAAKLGGQLPAYYAQASALPFKADVTYVDQELLDLATAVQLLLDQKAGSTETSNALASRIRFDAAQTLTKAQQGLARANMGAGVLSGLRDKIINGNGAISQRTYTTVADDAYWCDRHYVLTQTAAITPTILSDVANGLPSMMRLTQSQATAQRMGNATILEAAVSKPLRGKTVTLGGKLRCSASQAIRYAILEWTGTADAVTSDVVANWASGVYTPSNFFFASNLTVAAVGSITPSANALTDFALTASVSGSCNNLILVYWTEGTAAQNVTLDMAWGLVEGDCATENYPYEARHPQQELALCQWYCRRVERMVGNQFSTTASSLTAYFPEMRAAPSGVATTLLMTTLQLVGVGTATSLAALTAVTTTTNLLRVTITHNAAGSVGNPADATMSGFISAEL
jgi:hypothetical protein